MKYMRSVLKLFMPFILLGLFAGFALGGATLKVNWVAQGNTCDSLLTLEEATLIGRGQLGRAITSGEKGQISGATFVPAPPGPCSPTLWFITNGVGDGFADDIIFDSGMTDPIHLSIELGKNDDIDGTTGSSKVILDGTGMSPGTNGIFIDILSGSQVRNLEIRNFPGNGIFSQAMDGAIFEGLNVHNNGNCGISLGFAGGSTNKHTRNTRIGGDQPQQRNLIYANVNDGIVVNGSASTDRFPDEGIFILNNLIGTSDGVTDNGNGGSGIRLTNAFGVIIGDQTNGTRNIISGNNNDGITLDGPGAISNIVVGNYIGTTDSSSGRLGNGASGVALLNSAGSTADFISTGPNKIGMPGLGNVISANNFGVFIADPNTSLNRVQGNFIGTNISGNTDVGNNADGVYIVNGTFDNQIGGTGSGEGNLIAFNANGIKADSGVRNAMRRNRIFGNDNLGIDLAPAGVTLNDTGDGDSGPNNLQNYPLITYVNAQPSTITLNGILNSTPNTTFNVDFYGNSSVNATGFGEGRNFIGSTQLTTDASGNAIFFGLSFSSSPSNDGSWITATATDASGNTSEFSQARNICSNMQFSPSSASYGVGGGGSNFTVIYSGGCSSYTAQGDVPWINVTSVLAGTVTYTVGPNTGAARSGNINVTYNNGSGTAVAIFPISQAGGCQYNLSHFQASYSAGGIASDGLTLTAQTGCVWTAVPNASWITILAGSSGSGNGTVTWSVAANTGPARQGTITVAGQTFTINQASGCQYSLSRSSVSYSAGGTLSDSLTVSAVAGCTWTAVPSASWITILSGGSGSGNGTVTWSVAANAGPARQGTITIAGQTFTINQSSGCQYSLNRSSASYPAGGVASDNLAVTAAAGCGWAAVPSATWITILSGSSGIGNGTVTWSVAVNTGPARQGTITVGGQTFTINQAAGTVVSVHTPFDFDGDHKSDVSVFRPSTGAWYLNRSTAGVFGMTWGVSTDIMAPADYDGDGKTDVAVFRPSEGRWYIFYSATSTFSSNVWGVATDIPAPGDFDGDGRADVAIFRPSDGNWWLNRSTAGTLATQFGQNGDLPVVGDYDGDGKSDIGIFRPSNGVWFIRRSTLGDIGYQFGFGSDKLAEADYDGDGKTDIAVYRPSTGQWFIANSGSNTYPVIGFGAATDIPAPGDYDGDGKADVAIFRPSDGNWWLNRSSTGVTVMQFGQNGDKPVENAYGN